MKNLSQKRAVQNYRERIGQRGLARFVGREGPPALFMDRILPFDDKAALVRGRIMAEGTALGRPRSAIDMMIAAIAEANGCVVVTDNEKHFRGAADFINPLRQREVQKAESAGFRLADSDR